MSDDRDDRLSVQVPALALKPAQAAAAIGVSPRKLWSLTAGGEVPHVRLGKSVVYPVDQLRAWLADQAEGSVR